MEDNKNPLQGVNVGDGTETEADSVTVDAPPMGESIGSEAELGGRYRIWSKLGAGGMGEVWHAFDLKLRVEVALKALRQDLRVGSDRLELLRREVRAARQVVSPNVCRIYDLEEMDGRELVSMEYVDGKTLLAVLKERGPLELKEAKDIASQFLAGLEAIHQTGLIHRDIKPENIMLTRTGRVVVMDFGLARDETDPTRSRSGTPAYMAPEQARGEALDARADVYSAGVVLAEMVSPGGVKDLESRKSLWEAVRSDPPKLPDSPWAPVIKRAVAKRAEERYESASSLTRALEKVTQRVVGAEDVTPYPGLASFTEADAEYFFGREAEVERMWRKLEGAPRLLGLVGPSGAGKTSILRAGLIPTAGPDWGIVRCTPGDAAISSIRRALIPELAGDPEALQELVDPDDDQSLAWAVSRWRKRHDHGLLIVDQFEELLTQNSAEEQERFAAFLARIALSADVHVLLSLRDDFLAQCNAHEPLRPIFHELTVLDPPAGPNLRRALVQPAVKCGYRFEDDELVDQMLTEVEGERGALPLLAFAMARVWEKRDRDNGLLTRQAYDDIGGVGGALAQHAESTIDRIGSPRLPIVRELFRNLVTSEGTRAVREWQDLLSVFGEDSEAAEEVLRELVDARLLTSYEIQEEDQEPTRRVEIIHESLLANWPRLVRWQTQDADAAQLRDQLRQAARTWEEHSRSDDLLWTGSAYREFSLWRERYPGGLSDTESAFGDAMKSHAHRRTRRRRIAVATSFVVLLAVLAVIGGFWRRSVSETRRAEAAKLVSLGRVQLETHPTLALAHAVTSLELADTPEVRRLALEALWSGPTEMVLLTGSPYSLDFSPDGRWLLAGGKLWPLDGGPPTELEFKKTSGEGKISPTGDLIAYNIGWVPPTGVGLWSFPDGRWLRTLPTGGDNNQNFSFSRDGARLIVATESYKGDVSEVLIRSWPVAGGEPVILATLEVSRRSAGLYFGVDPAETRIAWIDGRNVMIKALDQTEAGSVSPTTLKHDRTLSTAVFDNEGRQLVTIDETGRAVVWALDRDPPELTRTFASKGNANPFSIRFNPSGTVIGTAEGYLSDLEAAPNAGPLKFTGLEGTAYAAAFHPEGTWFATGHHNTVSLWPLSHPYPQVLRGHESYVTDLHFTPDGEWLVSVSEAGRVRLWPLDPDAGEYSTVLYEPLGTNDVATSATLAPDGSFLATGTYHGGVRLIPLVGGSVRELAGFTDHVNEVAVGPRSRCVAASGGFIDAKQKTVRVWDLDSEQVHILDTGDGRKPSRLRFAGNGDLWVTSQQMLRRWALNGAPPRVVEEIDLSVGEFEGSHLWDLDQDRRQLLLGSASRLWIQDLDTGDARELQPHANMTSCRFDSTGEIVLTTDAVGAVRVTEATGGEPHLLLGHGYCLKTTASSPDGSWVASGGCDQTIRLWPMPDLSKPPIHTLPRDELIAKLKTFTNVRMVRDEESSTGWKFAFDPFPGWENLPTW